MKKIILMLMIFSTLAVTSQNKISDNSDARKEYRSDYTPEQRAALKTKKMTLALDLNMAQQKQIEQVFLQSTDIQKNKLDWKNMTSEQKFAAKNEALDRRIETKNQIKEILTPEQYSKWEENRSRSENQRLKKGKARELKKE